MCIQLILGVELVVPKKRALIGTILNTCYTTGEVLIALLAWYCRYWKWVDTEL